MFNERVHDWRISFQESEFKNCKLVNEELAKNPRPRSGVRIQTMNGIPTGARFKMIDSLCELYKKLVPDDQWLAHELAEDCEKEIFEKSKTITFYQSNSREKIRALKYQLEFEQKLHEKLI